MRGCTRLALLCALPWLLPLVAPGRPAPPAALRRDPRNPARGAEFDRIYSGVVSLPTENIYSFNYTSQPGQRLGRESCSESKMGMCEDGRELQNLCVCARATACVSVSSSHACASEKPEDPARDTRAEALSRSMEVLSLYKDG